MQPQGASALLDRLIEGMFSGKEIEKKSRAEHGTSRNHVEGPPLKIHTKAPLNVMSAGNSPHYCGGGVDDGPFGNGQWMGGEGSASSTPPPQRLRHHLSSASDAQMDRRVAQAAFLGQPHPEHPDLHHSLSAVEFGHAAQQHFQQQYQHQASSSDYSPLIVSNSAVSSFNNNNTGCGPALGSAPGSPFQQPGKLSHYPSAPAPAADLLDFSRTSPNGPPQDPPPQPATAAAWQPHAVAAGVEGGGSLLLATSAGTPASMRRAVWSLGDYDIAKRIYKSTNSAVYQATCVRSGMPVALKVYFLSKVPPNAMHMIAREITIHSGLEQQKNIVQLYGAFQEEGRLVLVQEYASRGDLYGIYKGMRRRMSEEQVQELVMVPFLEALTFLHTRGVCHRDVKPENLLFSQDWKLLIADFGVSINLHQERAVTRAGTLDYMAPEVERCPIKYLPQDNKQVPGLAYTTAVDVWAAGVLAYELLVGFPPFVTDNAAGGSQQAQQVQQVQQAQPGADDGTDADPVSAAVAPADGGGGGGGANDFLSQCTSKTLSFPASVSAAAREFISLALAELPEERPTAVELLNHHWLRRGIQRRLLQARSGSSTNIGGGGGGGGSGRTTPRAPSRLNLAVTSAAVASSMGTAVACTVGTFTAASSSSFLLSSQGSMLSNPSVPTLSTRMSSGAGPDALGESSGGTEAVVDHMDVDMSVGSPSGEGYNEASMLDNVNAWR